MIAGRRPLGFILACGLAALAAPVAWAQPALDRDRFSRLPASGELAIGASDFGALRASPAGRAVEALLSETGAWTRTLAAWEGLARSIDLPPDQAAARLSGSRLFVLMSGVGDDRPRHAVVTDVSRETEALLRSRLRPAPRGLVGNKPILSLERGAFEVATHVPDDGATDATVLISPRGGSALFDAVLPVVSGQHAATPLEREPWWPRVAALRPAPVLVVYHTPREEFLAVSADVNGGEVRADLVCTPDMLLPSLASAASDAAPARAWPAAAVREVEKGALMLLAGSPRDQMPLLGDGVRPQRTLLLTLLASLRLGEELEREIEGVAIVAAHPGADGSLSLTAAVPVRDLTTFAPAADRRVVAFASPDAPGAIAGLPAEGVRVLTLAPTGTPILGEIGGRGGSIAWDSVRSGAGPGGWWVVNIRTAPGEDALGVKRVQELTAALRVPAGVPDGTIFRLVLRPSDLMDRVAPAVVAAGPAKPSSLRWLRRIETGLRRDGAGRIAGEVRIEMNTDLLPK